MIIRYFKNLRNLFIGPNNLRNRPLVRALKNQPVRLIQVARPLASTITNQIMIMTRQTTKLLKIYSTVNLHQSHRIAISTPLAQLFQRKRPIGSAFLQVFVFKKNIHFNLIILIHL